MKKTSHIGIAVCLLQMALAHPGKAAPIPVLTPFDEDGYTVMANLDHDNCLVVSSIDLATMVAKTKDLQAKGLVRDDVNAAHVKAHAWTTAAAVALKLQPLFVVTFYQKTPAIDSCKFGQAFVDFDGKVNVAYSFTMTRAIYDKQNWSAFVATDLPSVAQDFTLGPATSEHMNAEGKLPE